MAGMDVARLNLSHADHEVHAEMIANLRQAMACCGQVVAIMLDTKGPEIRIGTFAERRVFLEAGAGFTLTVRQVPGTTAEVSVPYPRLTEEVRVGALLLIDDGKVMVEVKEVSGNDVRCRVLNGGYVSDRKKLTIPGALKNTPFLSEDDVADIRFGVKQGVDFLAASFAHRGEDVEAMRRVVREAGGDVHIIAKIESHEGVENLEAILRVSDGIMVARGDMGVEYPIEEVPLIQKRIIHSCHRVGKPVVTATQMLESMIHSPRPTRAEASDVANAILDGTDAVMLSAETATGEYPVEATKIMARIAERTDDALGRKEIAAWPGPDPDRTITDAISHATCEAAESLGATAIITATQSGHTARMVAKYRPRVSIIAATPLKHVARRLRLVWGVRPLMIEDKHSTEELFNETILEAIEEGVVNEGDLVVLTAGVPAGVPGSTNLLKVHHVGRIVLRGTGIGERVVRGRARLLLEPDETLRLRDDDILVIPSFSSSYMRHLGKATAVILEEEGESSPGARACASLGVPVVVGASGATRLIKNSDILTVDTPRGVVYEGEARVL